MLARKCHQSIPDYSTISRRVNKLVDIKVNEKEVGNYVVIALDSTGIKVSNHGELMRHKWQVRSRGYLKIHVVAVDIRKKKVVSLQVTSEEEVHDNSKMLKKLVKAASENNDVKRVIADDGAYDSNKKNFRYLSI
jgi:IS5 family transposase